MDQKERPVSYDEQRRRKSAIQRERREAQVRRNRRILGGVLAVVVLATAAVSAYSVIGEKVGRRKSASQPAHKQASAHIEETSGKEKTEEKPASPLDEADRLAAMYDYDEAIALLEGQADYQENSEMQQRVAQYRTTKDSCVAWPIDQVTHVFYHTLIVDPSRSFDGDSKEAGYDQVMTTIGEFNAITQSMYDRVFVMVSLKDMAAVTVDEATM